MQSLDGSGITLPGWKRLAEYFGTAKNGKGKGAPQARWVMLQFPLARIPYRYELAPNGVGEKTLAKTRSAGIHRLASHRVSDQRVTSQCGCDPRAGSAGDHATRVAGHEPDVDHGFPATRFARSPTAADGSDRLARCAPTPRTPLRLSSPYKSQNHRQRQTPIAQQAASKYTTRKENEEESCLKGWYHCAWRTLLC